jgi:uncharacterized membrane protein YcjF (UPF0283 family)
MSFKVKMYLNLVLTFILAYAVGLVASSLIGESFSDLERIGFGLSLYFIYATIKSVKTVEKLNAALRKLKTSEEMKNDD